jgi:hypothetical protein
LDPNPPSGPPQDSNQLEKYQASSRVASWVFGALILIFLMIVVFVPIETSKFPIVRFLMALSAGFFAIFFVGGVLLRGTLYGLAYSATGGVALFILIAVVFDPFSVLPTASSVPAATATPTLTSTPIPTLTPSTSTKVNGTRNKANSSDSANLSANDSRAQLMRTASLCDPNTMPKLDTFFDNWDVDPMSNPPSETSFTLTKSSVIVNIYNLHRVGATLPGEGIKLRNSAGAEFGPFLPIHPGGENNSTWEWSPCIQIPAGTYTVIDPDPATWSQSASHHGKSMIQGYTARATTKQ